MCVRLFLLVERVAVHRPLMARLHADPRYETVMWKPDGAQAIFRRRFAAIERQGP